MQANDILSEEVATAIAEHRPVVALESTIISHGFPRPRNLEVAHLFEDVLRDRGVTPATIALVDGKIRVGLTESELDRIANDDTTIKVSIRDLPIAMSAKRMGATTVAATSMIAAKAGIRVFATGGLGGVHRGAQETFDESADLTGLSHLPVTVVAAGVKSILDIPATLERLETLSVGVVGYRTSTFPGFYLTSSGMPLDWRVESAGEIAQIMAAADQLGDHGALVVANPLPEDKQMDVALHERVLAEALALAEENHIAGKDVTPFVLDYFQRATGGISLDVNTSIACNNIALAAEIAQAWTKLR